MIQKIASYLHWVKIPKDEKNKEPPKIEQNQPDDLTDSEIKFVFVPSDPFLCVHHDFDEDKDDQTKNVQEYAIKKFTILMPIYQMIANLSFDLF